MNPLPGRNFYSKAQNAGMPAGCATATDADPEPDGNPGMRETTENDGVHNRVYHGIQQEAEGIQHLIFTECHDIISSSCHWP